MLKEGGKFQTEDSRSGKNWNASRGRKGRPVPSTPAFDISSTFPETAMDPHGLRLWSQPGRYCLGSIWKARTLRPGLSSEPSKIIQKCRLKESRRCGHDSIFVHDESLNLMSEWSPREENAWKQIEMPKQWIWKSLKTDALKWEESCLNGGWK